VTTPKKRRIAYMPLSELRRANRNPKGHALEVIAASMSRFGTVEAPALDERTGQLVAGHGRLDTYEQLKAAGGPPPEGVTVRRKDGEWLVPVQRGWSSEDDAEAEGYLITSNQSTILGGWQPETLAAMLAEQQASGTLDGTGFTPNDLDELMADLEASRAKQEPEGFRDSDGSLLSLSDVSVGEPIHQVEHGQVWRLGGRHVLVVARIIQEWSLWIGYLTGDAYFCPYPGVYIALSVKASEHPLVMVQPNNYLAGHVLDKWAAINGSDTVVLERAHA
jgi:hypothetical protein